MQIGKSPSPNRDAGRSPSPLREAKAGLVAASHPSVRAALRPAAKRVFDQVIAALLLVFVAPTMAVAAILLRAEGGPVFVAYPRVGRGGVVFNLLRFRTIDPTGSFTSVGAMLWRIRIDGLPRLINVLRGEMSLVGPRAATRAELDAMDDEMANCYLGMRPGLTGTWRLAGLGSDCDGVDGDLGRRRTEIDIAYARTPSLRTDLLLFIRSMIFRPH